MSFCLFLPRLMNPEAATGPETDAQI